MSALGARASSGGCRRSGPGPGGMWGSVPKPAPLSPELRRQRDLTRALLPLQSRGWQSRRSGSGGGTAQLQPQPQPWLRGPRPGGAQRRPPRVAAGEQPQAGGQDGREDRCVLHKVRLGLPVGSVWPRLAGPQKSAQTSPSKTVFVFRFGVVLMYH